MAITAAVLLSLSVLLVGFTVLGAHIPSGVHVAGHLLLFAFLAAYPVFRLTRRLVGRFIALTRTRWAAWNWVWTLSFVWFFAAGVH